MHKSIKKKVKALMKEKQISLKYLSANTRINIVSLFMILFFPLTKIKMVDALFISKVLKIKIYELL